MPVGRRVRLEENAAVEQNLQGEVFRVDGEEGIECPAGFKKFSRVEQLEGLSLEQAEFSIFLGDVIDMADQFIDLATPSLPLDRNLIDGAAMKLSLDDVHDLFADDHVGALNAVEAL